MSVCSIGYIDNDVCPTPAPPTLVWCPAGDRSRIVIRVRALGAAGAPCAGCPLVVTAMFRGMPILPATNLWVCGAVGGVLTTTVVTDAIGEAQVEITGGGCGCLVVDYSVNAAACGGPAVLCSGSSRFCVKSPDFTGNGIVNFADTARYLPMLAAGFGYCGDFNCNGVVNFADTAQYLPHLFAAHACTFGSIVPIATDCTLPCM
jgi:hypothetical protein